jgi:uncharacterized protein (TIGR03067 family)
MRQKFFILAVFLGIAATTAAEAIPSGTDTGRLQGLWRAQAGPRHDIRVDLEVKGRCVNVFIASPQGFDFQAQGEMKLDETTSPRSLDWVNFSGPDQQRYPQIPSVYKIEGDTFTVCTGGFHGSRPSEFKPGDGVLTDVVVFHRLTSSAPHSKGTSAPKPESSPKAANHEAATKREPEKPGPLVTRKEHKRKSLTTPTRTASRIDGRASDRGMLPSTAPRK